jgi:hypothetical protein
MAGLMRLEEAVPYLVARLHLPDDAFGNDCMHSLRAIGTDRAVESVYQEYAHDLGRLWFNVDGVFAGLDSDLAVDRACRLMEAAEEEERRGLLGNIVLGAFDPGSVEAIRQVAIGCFGPEEVPDTGEINDLRLNLASAGVLMDVTFPERDAWLENAARRRVRFQAVTWEREDRMREAAEQLFGDGPDDLLPFEYGEEADEGDDYFTPVEPVRVERKPGRNEPCPCGSGRKYKRCCGRG